MTETYNSLSEAYLNDIEAVKKADSDLAEFYFNYEDCGIKWPLSPKDKFYLSELRQRKTAAITKARVSLAKLKYAAELIESKCW